MTPSDPLLDRHLGEWLGAWPPADGEVRVVGSQHRVRPGWDGSVGALVAVATPSAAVVSVPPEAVAAARAAVDGLGVDRLTDAGVALAGAVGRPEGRVYQGVFRWSSHPVAMADAGVWLPAAHPSVPGWLRPFGGDVLVIVDDGHYVAGVGIKRHDSTGQELAVGTEPAARGRGLARRLVSKAARRIVDGGAVATYLHAPGNAASARVAEAAGFEDHGWRILGIG